MKTLILALTAAAMVAGSAGVGAANAQGHRQGWSRPGWGHDRGNHHHWSRGQRMGYNDWRQARRVDYRRHHLRAPPRGYEWRESNGQYVLAAVATGLIASIILASH